MNDAEPLLLELLIDHDLQLQEFVGLMVTYATTHVEKCVPRYNDVDLVPAVYVKNGSIHIGPVRKAKK